MTRRTYRGGSKPLTIEDMQAIAAARGGRCLSAVYVSSHTPLEWECARGHRWWAKATYVKHRTWCGICAREAQRGTLSDMQRLAHERAGRCLSVEYVNGHTPLEWECAQGHRWWAKGAQVKRGTWCGACAKEEQYGTLTDMQRLAYERGGQCLSVEYINVNTHLEWECVEGHWWRATPKRVKVGSWCPTCARKRRRLPLAEIQAAAEAMGGRCLSQEYVNSSTPLQFECAAGHRWWALPPNVRKGHWCQLCQFDRMRSTIDQMRTLAASHDGRCLSAAYISARHPLQWECRLGHVWSSKPAVVCQGKSCPLCANLNRSTKRSKRLKYDYEG